MNLGENPVLGQEVESDNELKTWLVNYVGDKHNPENGDITVEMIIETMSEQFPEFLMVVAEENWIRGYHQGLSDVDEGEALLRENEPKSCDNNSCSNCECDEENG